MVSKLSISTRSSRNESDKLEDRRRGTYNRNDQHRLLKPVLLSRSEEERLEDLPVEAGSERGEAGKLNLLKKLHGGAFAVDVVALNVAVHESD
jgi:hypothetical protein